MQKLKFLEEQTIPSDQQRSLREIRTNFWCDDENRKGPDGDDSIMHWSTSADGSALPFSQPHLETAAAKDNDVVCLSDEEESVSSSSDVWAECTTVDKYDRFGRLSKFLFYSRIYHAPSSLPIRHLIRHSSDYLGRNCGFLLCMWFSWSLEVNCSVF